MAKKKKQPQPKKAAQKPKEGSGRLKERLPLLLLTVLLYTAGLLGCALVFLRCDTLPVPDLYIVLLCLAPAALLSSPVKFTAEENGKKA